MIRSLQIIALLITNITFTVTVSAVENQKQNPYAVYKFPMKHSYIALSPLPGRVDLEEDMQTITANEITSVVTLVSNEELEKYKVPTLLEKYSEHNLQLLHSPIPDYGLPTPEQMKTILVWVHKKIKAKENVLIHCVGGLGRSGTVMAVYAKAYLGKTGQEAIDYVRSIRGADAIETAEQQNFVISW
ncbi:MAG: dual specificity protein phosphatase family protein [Crocinitomicaceae bacterium]|nr:dual specificity protein phosphatase family protein [Crocinitomicaceae bacterium]